ncbi:hypothetical protein [Alkalicoccobacillus gibsonii]|jgi:hypothetical protein|uniref:hypothetical protein n=1 Tax=Alkalicoccobacillus gibsonii TaxID=79881 RepID=UPI001934751A|nr:hypothetical protein [Alkalicoccobacillus gibsonii]MBM0067961.1 hypothetical protein [Alkalicoccobacillus gibsonii]
MSTLYTIIEKHRESLEEGNEVVIGTNDSVVSIIKKEDPNAMPDLEIYVSPFNETVPMSTDCLLDQE